MYADAPPSPYHLPCHNFSICRHTILYTRITYRQVRCMNIHQIRRRRRLVLSTTPTTSGTRTTWPGHVTRPFPTRSRVSATRSTYYTSSSAPRETWSCWTKDEVRFCLKTTTSSAIAEKASCVCATVMQHGNGIPDFSAHVVSADVYCGWTVAHLSSLLSACCLTRLLFPELKGCSIVQEIGRAQADLFFEKWPRLININFQSRFSAQ